MTDTVDSQVLANTKLRHVVRLYNASDGTGEAAVVKVDKSSLTGPDGTEPGRLVVERIVGNVEGMSVRLHWDHTTPDEIAVLTGPVDRDYRSAGGLKDPATAGGTG